MARITITSLINRYYDSKVSKFEALITKEEKKLAEAFIYLAIDIYKLIEGRLREDETLQAYRKEMQEAFSKVGLKGSNYTFANMMKIGRIAENNLTWLLGFKNLSVLAIGIASFEMVPACKGIKGLEIKPVINDNKTTVQSVIDKIEPEKHNAVSLREVVNGFKGISKAESQVESKIEPKIEPEIEISKAVDTSAEKHALQIAKIIADYRDNEAFLLAFSVQLLNLKIINTIKASIDDVLKNNKRVDLSIS